MCIIAVKYHGQKFPEWTTLERCFDNNPDGAGFMYPKNGKVQIKKGLMTWEEFRSALETVRAAEGDDIPYIMHFRISTQGGVNKMCTHPFPLSGKMKNLRKLNTSAKVGIAHNGMIPICEEFGKGIDYSDTMKFITDYASLIIEGDVIDDEKKCKLLERIAQSRLAIMNGKGQVVTLGEGWRIGEDGCCYSNSSYEASYHKYVYIPADQYEGFGIWDGTYSGVQSKSNVWSKQSAHDYWELYRLGSGEYDFTEYDCPVYEGGDYCDWCGKCANRHCCSAYAEMFEDFGELADSPYEEFDTQMM